MCAKANPDLETSEQTQTRTRRNGPQHRLGCRPVTDRSTSHFNQRRACDRSELLAGKNNVHERGLEWRQAWIERGILEIGACVRFTRLRSEGTASDRLRVRRVRARGALEGRDGKGIACSRSQTDACYGTAEQSGGDP